MIIWQLSTPFSIFFCLYWGRELRGIKEKAQHKRDLILGIQGDRKALKNMFCLKLTAIFFCKKLVIEHILYFQFLSLNLIMIVHKSKVRHEQLQPRIQTIHRDLHRKYINKLAKCNFIKTLSLKIRWEFTGECSVSIGYSIFIYCIAFLH